MKALRPYLLRAFHTWMLDNGWTPLLIVDATAEGAVVPQSHVQDGRIVLNIAPKAVRNLVIGDEELSFGARFGGAPFAVYLPIQSLLGIYAEETGQVLGFPPEEIPAEKAPDDAEPPVDAEGNPSADESQKKSNPHLRIIK